MADNVEFSAFSKRELGKLAKTFMVMGEDAVARSKEVAFDIALLAKDRIRNAGYGRTKSAGAVRRVVDGVTVSKTSKTGQLSYGFAGQRFSGGANTRQLWAGLEFGSYKWRQFPVRSPRYGAKGNQGYFIYPTLRATQPELTLRYLSEMNKVVEEWSRG